MDLNEEKAKDECVSLQDDKEDSKGKEEENHGRLVRKISQDADIEALITFAGDWEFAVLIGNS